MTVPVTLLAGFLGSGKTTLVRRILHGAHQGAHQGDHGLRCAVIVNEFGEVGIDGDLIERSALKRGGPDDASAVVELANGCICCEIQDDLRTTLLNLVPSDASDAPADAANARFDRILVEASGAASPGPAVQTFLIDGVLQSRVHLDRVVTLVHAGLIEHLLQETVEAEAQVAYADRIVLNHMDRVTPRDAERLTSLLGELNPLAQVRAAEQAEVPPDWIFGAVGDGPLAEMPRLMGEAIQNPDRQNPVVHTPGLRSVSLVAPGPVNVDALVIWLEFLSKRRSHELMRAKGVVAASGSSRGLEIQGVYRWLEVTDASGPPPSDSRLVLIGRDLDEAEIRRGWAAVSAAT